MAVATFDQLGLIEPILNALNDLGYESPTPIQAQSIPYLLQGRDLLGCAQTGTGKTAAFAVPLIQHMQLAQGEQPHKGRRPIKALILTPTRELAIQIDDSFKDYAKYTKLRTTVIFGGVGQKPQTDALKRGIDILVATPGRLLDLMGQGYVDLKQLDYFVLDEADRMLDMGFIHDVRRVITALPAKRNTLFFSATMPREVQKLADSLLNDPAKVMVTPGSTTAETVQQEVYFVDKPNKAKLLIHLLQTRDMPEALVFSRTKHGADKLVRLLKRADIRAEAIHGNKSQNARQRALKNFKERKARVLVATDIAARGIDIDSLSFVVNYDIPNVPETYVHRIGRTGRAGASGIALSLCDAEERPYLRDITKLIAMQIPVIEEHPFPATDGGAQPEMPPKGKPRQQQRRKRQPTGTAEQLNGDGRGKSKPRSKASRSGRGRGADAASAPERGKRASGRRSDRPRNERAPEKAAPQQGKPTNIVDDFEALTAELLQDLRETAKEVGTGGKKGRRRGGKGHSRK